MESHRRYVERNRAKVDGDKRRWYLENRDRILESRRNSYDYEKRWVYYISVVRPRLLLAERERVVEKLRQLDEGGCP